MLAERLAWEMGVGERLTRVKAWIMASSWF
jgi:hypothetical protein